MLFYRGAECTVILFPHCSFKLRLPAQCFYFLLDLAALQQ